MQKIQGLCGSTASCDSCQVYALAWRRYTNIGRLGTGGIYEGSEAAYIMDVKLVAGPEQQSSEHRTSLKAQSIRTDL